ncbi:hypothetical protein ARMA_2827 [Ardenticatena maritima]|uniref:Uncharacterized protein n=1 Tax=Ardenticatena maritima TaxID=872965 RepID=A0A0M8K9C2_9CHLR|nr:hypothetical protein ARMA_2827 [Ardenticatena maritima]
MVELPAPPTQHKKRSTLGVTFVLTVSFYTQTLVPKNT